MTVRQAAERMECSISTVYALVGAGRIKCNRIGLGRGAIRITEQQVADYLQAKPDPTGFKHITLK